MVTKEYYALHKEGKFKLVKQISKLPKLSTQLFGQCGFKVAVLKMGINVSREAKHNMGYESAP